jgi:glycosyltransferase involved in cell wall biosynthesis
MRICKVWDSDYPWDVRVQKVAGSLSDAGHEVHLVARNRKRLADREKLHEAAVHRLHPWRVLPAGLDGALMFPAFFNPRWLSKILATARETGSDVILVRDLPLAPTAIFAARQLGIPVVLDMAENYPAMMQSLWDNGIQGRFDWAVRNPKVVAAVERWAIHRMDRIIVVVEESRDRLVDLGVEYRARPSSASAPLRLVYLGLMEAPRGISNVIEAVARYRAAGLPVELSLIGGGRELEPFRQQARELCGNDETIRFHGYVPYADALKIVEKADVGLVPHLPNQSWNTTIPNKLFDYMAAGLPVISSDARPAARIVRETECGEVFSTVDELVEALHRMTPERRQQYGWNGYRAVIDRYNWDSDATRLLGVIEGLGRPEYRKTA